MEKELYEALDKAGVKYETRPEFLDAESQSVGLDIIREYRKTHPIREPKISARDWASEFEKATAPLMAYMQKRCLRLDSWDGETAIVDCRHAVLLRNADEFSHERISTLIDAYTGCKARKESSKES